MANFRRNHGKEGRRSSFIGKAVLTTAILIGLMIFAFLKFSAPNRSNTSNQKDGESLDFIPIKLSGRQYLPVGKSSDVVHHSYYSIGYNTKKEIPDWVAYELTKESLKIKNVPRAKRFIVDNEVKGKSAKHGDYINSGYTRGHMAPAGDMAFSEKAMRESFYMSNMAPQLRNFNGGIWRELEENVRDWTYDNDVLYVVSGPIFDDEKYEKIGGSTKVAVPDAFFKAILDLEGRSEKGIGFIIPHDTQVDHLREFAVSIDEIEKQTGLDLYSKLFTSDDNEEALESSFNVNSWQISRSRFDQRVKHWNNQK